MTARLLTFFAFALALADSNDPTQIENYNTEVKTYKLDVPGGQPITIIEKDNKKRRDVTFDMKIDKDDEVIKNLMTHIVHDLDGNEPRCYGPSCRDSNENDDVQEDFEDYMLAAEKLKDFRDYPAKDRLQAITALAAKLKKNKYKHDRFSQIESDRNQDDDSDKVITSWNRMKVKQHKHPFDDKDGWVTLEPVAWSTSKISKWKPNVKKQKPWHDDENRFPDDDRFSSNQGFENNYNYPVKKPILSRPGFINNKLHVPSDYESELPSKPIWSKPQLASYPSMWSPDEGRRPEKPNCDSEEHYSHDDSIYYGMSDSVVTDPRPSNFPYEYEALHQASSMKRPLRRPTQVVYSGPTDYDSDRSSRPPYGDGQWVLLSTTKGYRNKKRQRALNVPPEDNVEAATVTSHQAVSLTVLPMESARTNMTTSHGGILEVEKSFQTVEESKQDMDKQQDLEMSASQVKPVKNRAIRKKLVSNNISPDSSTLLAAVGAGMVPATMAMVVPMMLGRRRRRRDVKRPLSLDTFLYRYQ